MTPPTQPPPHPAPPANGYRADSPLVRAAIEATAAYYGIEAAALTAKGRVNSVARIRMSLMYVLRQRGLSLHEIGDCLGRDHSTVMYGLGEVEKRMAADDSFRREVAYLLEGIKA
jgi:chromosomal replication initiation ATPase DnaA